MVAVAASSASTRGVLPEPEWPTSTTLRTLPGSVTTGAVAPLSPFSEVFCAMASAPVKVSDCYDAVTDPTPTAGREATLCSGRKRRVGNDTGAVVTGLERTPLW